MTNTTIHPDDARVIPEWNLADRLGKALRVSNLGVSEVADYLGVSRASVGRWVNGHTRPSKATLIVLSDLTGVDRRWLMQGAADELRARRDSNPKPSGLDRGLLLVSGRVKPGLTPKGGRPVCRTVDPKRVP